MSEHDDFPYEEAVAPCRYCGTLLDGQGHNELGRYHDVHSCREYAVTALRARVAELERIINGDCEGLLSEHEALEDTFRTVRDQRDELTARCARLEDIVRDCGTDGDNLDTCGVCGEHFAECATNLRAVPGREGDGVTESGCPGGRARAALSESRTVEVDR